LVVDHPGIDISRSEPGENLIEGPVAIPLVEKVPGGAPGAVLLGQVTPGGARPQDPEDRVDDLATASWGASGHRRGREEILDEFPLVIGKLMSEHGGLSDRLLNPSCISLSDHPTAKGIPLF
jgi:hypothetical protein